MSIVVKAGAGLVAGVVAGALGLAFLPRIEPNILKPRNAVEKPQFVVASAPVAVTPQPKATLAVAVEPPAPKPAPTPEKVAPRAVESPATVALVKADPVAPSAPVAPVASPKAVALVAAAPASPVPASPVLASPVLAAPVSLKPATQDAARWSVRGLVALARGDLSHARLFLNRAAEAGDARAWVALADTYDPAMLNKLGVVFAPGDPQRARDCLVKAMAAGVVVAKDRLAALESDAPPLR